MSGWGTGSAWGLGSPWGAVPSGASFGCATAQTGILAQSAGGDFSGWICAFASEAGAQLDGIASIAAAFALDTAVGVQLDVLGSLLGLPRSGFPDDRYRTFLGIQRDIVSGRASGSTASVLEICRAFIGPGSGAPIVCKTTPPYAFAITVPDIASFIDMEILASFLRKAIYLGVLGQAVFVPEGDNFLCYEVEADTAGAGLLCYQVAADTPGALLLSAIVTIGDP